MMSLINEALKQAERDRQNPSDRAMPQTVRSPAAARAKRPRPKPLKLVIASAIVLAAAAGWMSLQARGKLPAGAEAVGTVMHTPRLEQLEATLGRTHTAQRETHQTPQPATPDAQAPTEASTVSAKSATSRPSRAPAQLEVANASALTGPSTPPAPGQHAIAAADDGNTTPTSTPSEAWRDGFDLKGIFHGPGGARAIINDRLVRRGQKIGKATVIQIGTNTVELEMHGQRITLGI